MRNAGVRGESSTNYMSPFSKVSSVKPLILRLTEIACSGWITDRPLLYGRQQVEIVGVVLGDPPQFHLFIQWDGAWRAAALGQISDGPI